MAKHTGLGRQRLPASTADLPPQAQALADACAPLRGFGANGAAPVKTLMGLQWLRALAAASVATFHAFIRRGETIEVGQAGVDIFFVISGFLMWVITERGISPAAFVRDRVVRVVPLYWLATIVMVLGGLAGLFPHLDVRAAYVAKSLLFLPYSNDTGHLWPILVQGWTLDYEMAFYAVFALLLAFRRRLQLAGLAAVVWGVVLIGAVVRPQAPILRFYTDPIALEFLAGALLGWAYVNLPGWSRPVGWAATVAGLVLFGIAASAPVHDQRVLAYGAPAALLVAGVISLERSGLRFSNPVLAYVGAASYSIYLFHTMAVSVGLKLFPFALGVVGSLLTALLAIVVGCAVHETLEKPLVAHLRRRRSTSSKSITQNQS